MLIFLAGVAFLLILVIAGEQAGTRLFHGGSDRYFERCPVCERRYLRASVATRGLCPLGHQLESAAPAREGLNPIAVTVAALCAGFVVVAVMLTLVGVAGPP